MEISAPAFPRLISRFWQKMQRSVQPEKKTVPDPVSPLRNGSSQ
jgi:hypothetical protein